MDRWLTFAKERLQLPVFALLVAGISASGIYIASREFQWIPFFFSFLGIYMLFVLLRLMDEVKDIDKDRIAHPQRPLPRGLIAKHEVVRVIEMTMMVLFAYSLVLWVLISSHAALAYLCVVIYLWMMYKEFGIGHWLSSHPLLYGLSHQLVLFPLAIFAVTVVNPNAIASGGCWSFACLLMGAFFTYEICRKLDPHAHPVLATYIHYHGFRRTFEVTLLMVALSAMGALALNVAPLLLPCEFVVVAAMATLFFQPALFRIPELVASISLVLHVWAVALFRMF